MIGKEFPYAGLFLKHIVCDRLKTKRNLKGKIQSFQGFSSFIKLNII